MCSRERQHAGWRKREKILLDYRTFSFITKPQTTPYKGYFFGNKQTNKAISFLFTYTNFIRSLKNVEKENMEEVLRSRKLN